MSPIEAQKGQMLDAGQVNTLASLYFGIGRIISERELEGEFEIVVGA